MVICSILGDIATQNMHDVEFDISRSLKVKEDGAIRKPTYDFLSVNNSKYVPICSILRDIATENRHELEFDLSKSLKVEVNVASTKPTYDVLLVNNYNYMLICIGSCAEIILNSPRHGQWTKLDGKWLSVQQTGNLKTDLRKFRI